MKKVLIALDYDPTAQKVAEVGFLLAKSMGAEVLLVHIITDPVFYTSTEYSPIMGLSGYMKTGQLQLDSLDGLKKAAHYFLNNTKLHLGDTTIQSVIKEGDIAESILITAKDFNADIIVTGTHSRRWLESIIMGSVTEKVLHHSQIPLFIIPTKNHHYELAKE
ncbi:MAG: universal stress protein [Prolixibacteraceae bacterium]|jgi:nucleotide-binding universal stress UspA family protein|nr:universal stress protein [Prolixibacteraceae bacterium]